MPPRLILDPYRGQIIEAVSAAPFNASRRRSKCDLQWESELRYALQLANSPHFNPFDNENISGVIEARAMGANKFARLKVLTRQLASSHIVARGVVAKIFNDAILAIHDCHACKQVWDNHVSILVDIEMARSIGAVEKVKMLSFKRKALNTLIAAIRNVE